MEVSMKYPLNPLAACFVPLSMKGQTGRMNEDVQSTGFGKSVPFYTLKHEAPSTNRTKTTGHSRVKNLDLICKPTTVDDLCFTSKNSEVGESVHAMATPKKLISDEASIDRFEDRTNIEKAGLPEQRNRTGNCSMEFERTLNMAYENTELPESERTLDLVENTDPIKTNPILNMAHENKDSETVEVGNVCTSVEQVEDLADYGNKTPGQYKSSTGSLQSTRSNQSDYGTDIENIDSEDSSDLSSEMLKSFKSHETTIIEKETTPELLSEGSEKPLNSMKNSNTENLYLKALISSILSSKNDNTKICSREVSKGRSKHEEKCVCPPMFGWIIPFEYFGNPLNLTGACKKNYMHTTYENAIYDDTACVPTVYQKSLHFENHSIDSGHYSDEDEPYSSVEGSTLEQCSSELDSIIKDVFDCVDKSLSLCDDEKPHTADNSEVWKTADETEVFQVKDSPVTDDGYHPLLQEITPEEEVDTGISIIEKFLGEAFAFGDKRVNERHPSKSCIPPCSVWCSNVPPSAIDAYKKFVKKMDTEPVNNKVAEEKIFRKPIYKRCFSASDTPKGFEYGVLNLASSWEPKEQIYQKDLAAFTDSKGKTHNNSSYFSSGQPTNPLKEGSDKWSLYDGADSLWQPLPDCVLSSDHSQKYAYKKARILKRQKSVG